jgi:hypothetical protein
MLTLRLFVDVTGGIATSIATSSTISSTIGVTIALSLPIRGIIFTQRLRNRLRFTFIG